MSYIWCHIFEISRSMLLTLNRNQPFKYGNQGYVYHGYGKLQLISFNALEREKWLQLIVLLIGFYLHSEAIQLLPQTLPLKGEKSDDTRRVFFCEVRACNIQHQKHSTRWRTPKQSGETLTDSLGSGSRPERQQSSPAAFILEFTSVCFRFFKIIL